MRMSKGPRPGPVLAVLAASLMVYANSLYYGFAFDDQTQILSNPWIKNPRFYSRIFSENVWGFMGMPSNYYRPMMYAVYILDYRVFGLKAWGFHLTNILFHAGASALVFLTAYRLTAQSGREGDAGWASVPFAAALLFAVHPVHTEAVAWVGGLPDVSFTFFCLLSFYLYIRSESPGMTALSTASFFIASLCKEPALTLPLLLAAYDYSLGEGSLFPPRRLKRYVPYLAAAGVYLALRWNALGGFAPTSSHSEAHLYDYFVYAAILFFNYMLKLLFPAGLNAIHVFHPPSSMLAPVVALSLLAAAGFVWLLLLTARKSRTAFMALMFILVPLLPSFYTPALNLGLSGAFAERYLYLPVFGFAMLLSMAFERARGLAPGRRGWTAALALAIVCLFSAAAVARNRAWRDDMTLWSDTVKGSPDSAVARKGLGYTLLNAGRVDEAIGQLNAGLRIDPLYPELYINLGAAYETKGMKDLAARYLRRAIRLAPASAAAHYSLGHVLYGMGDADGAIAEYRTAIRLQPGMAEAHNNLGLAYSDKGWTDMAVKEYGRALEYDPGSLNALYNLGTAYAARGQYGEAVRDFLAALKVDPDYADAYNSLGVISAEEGRRDKAVRYFETAVRRQPDNPAFRANLARAEAMGSATPAP